LYNRVT